MVHTKPSKTTRKREHLALQELGERLIGLSADELSHLPIDDGLRDAVLAVSAIKAHGALRRQKQLIGRLMRQVDATPIRQALDARNADARLAKRVFAEAERWRDRVVRDGRTAIDAFAEVTSTDEDALIEMLTEMRSSANERTAKTARRRIFQNIHAALLACAQDDRIPQ